MSESDTLGPWIKRFLSEHIVTERSLSRNTQKSYRDTIKLLLPFVSSKVRKPIDRLAFRDLSSRRVLQFLAHIEEERGCSAQTRNQRLTAIRAFARFVASREPVHVAWCGADPGHSFKEGGIPADYLADQDGDGRDARHSQPQYSARPE